MIVDAVVLAAGESARLGRAKQLLPFAGQTLLGHAIATVRAAAPRRLLVILGAHAAEIRAGTPAGAVEVIENPAWRTGVGSSIHAALAALGASPPDGLLLAVCDQPLVPAAHFAHLRRAFTAHPTCIVASGYDEIAGVPALFPRALFAELAALPASEGARSLLRRHPDRLVTLPCPGAGRDVDTPDDYRRLF
jgi:molybdenum cofactor cytidylyltransferase